MRRDDPAGLILVVEDNRNLSEMVGEYLESRASASTTPATAWTATAWRSTTATT